jgi:hypothetical protein
MDSSFRNKLVTVSVILSSFFGYLEWGTEESGFLFQMEINILRSGVAQSLMHPAFLIPFFGQLLLLLTLFQSQPKRWMIYTGIGMLALLLVFIFVIGILSGNIKILLSAAPFIAGSTMLIAIMKKNPVLPKH